MEKLDPLFKDVSFDNRFVQGLPGDPDHTPTPRQVTGACFSRVTPRRAGRPSLVAFSKPLARTMGFDPKRIQDSKAFTHLLAGNALHPQMDPFAMCYGGHQFGHWAGQLGDGRAINLGEILSPGGQRWILQLKGAGLTPYSRRADGLAVLRSSIREFLCSEAMYHLGIPTTRALSLVRTGDLVERDMFYDGHPKMEPGAVVCRTAPSFIRFGNFQLPAARGDIPLLKQLLDYTLAVDFPHLDPRDPRCYLDFFREVCERTCTLMVHWMRVGFVHGVMNTDNMSILGLTLDYGPYGWLEAYDPQWTPNTTDAQGRRYAFANQPDMALWNLAQLAQALHPLISDSQGLQDQLQAFARTFKNDWETMMGEKLGFFQRGHPLPAPISELIQDLHPLLVATHADFTRFFRALGRDTMPHRQSDTLPKAIKTALYRPEKNDPGHMKNLARWLHQRRQLLKAFPMDPERRRCAMDQVNPKYVLRNYLVQEAIDLAEQGDDSRIHTLLKLIETPYARQPGMEEFAKKQPEWARHRPGCSMLSCSS
ncbi:MAG: YdiU family protein [Desulfobacterales bacterium]|nr:YdiU family protein [Desulfobacterales bacterium]